MKTTIKVFILFLLFNIYSCKEDENDILKQDVILFINSELKSCWDESNSVERPFIQGKLNESDTDWLLIPYIKGFDYQEGFYYKIKVREFIRKNPLMDQPDSYYELISILSKEKADPL